MKRFWISWYTAIEENPDTAWPWWISGETFSEPVYWTICALIDAGSQAEAKAKALAAFPDANESTRKFELESDWRFCEEKSLDWTPGDRFRMTGPCIEKDCS